MTKELHSILGLGEIYKKGKKYLIELEARFYIGKRRFEEIKGSCGRLHAYTKGAYDEYYREDCMATDDSCMEGNCVEIREKDRKSEAEIRKGLAEGLGKEIKFYERKKLKTENEIRLAKFDNYDASDEEKKLAENEKIIDLLKKIDPESVELAYKPTPRIVLPD